MCMIIIAAEQKNYFTKIKSTSHVVYGLLVLEAFSFSKSFTKSYYT